MLIIISDLHLTDGTSGDNLTPDAFDIFVDRIQDMAIRASWRADGTYRPVERIDLVLLGDVLDLVASNCWLEGETRPWDQPQAPETVTTVHTIVDGILRHNAASLSRLRSLASEGSLRLPPASQSGQPLPGAEGYPLHVRTHYMVGNRDWFLHLPGNDYNSIRRKVAQHLGLANSPEEPFPHEAGESHELLNTLRRHRVMARHGDIYDPLSFSEERDLAGVDNLIVVQLMLRFVQEVHERFGDDLPLPVVAGLRELDHVRPLPLVSAWLSSLLQRCCPSAPLRMEIRHSWDRLVDEMLQLEAIRQRDAWSPFNLAGGLEHALKFSRRTATGWADNINRWLHGLRGAASHSFCHHALTEQDFRNRRARHLVYGHTHQAEAVPLDASYADGFILNQVYFNAGTWRRVYQRTQWTTGGPEFVPAEQLNFLTFFQGDERGGRPYETWSATLGTNPDGPPLHRVDAGRTEQAAQPTAGAKPVLVAPPHFRPASNRHHPSAMPRL